MKRTSSSTSPKPAAKAKLRQQSPEPCEPGPGSLAEAFQWPADMIAAVCRDEGRVRRLTQMLNMKWRISSDYSGLRTEEVCLAALNKALEEHLGKKLEHSFLYSCDIDTVCQSVTLGTAADRKPLHCFKDLNFWLTDEASDRLTKAENLLPRLPPDADKVERNNLLKQKPDLYHDMGKWLLENVNTAMKDTAFCLEHMKECKLNFEEPREDDEATMEVAGLTCIAWSSYGKHEGFAHPSMRPFFVWACLMRKRRPLVLVVESASKFPTEKLEEFLGDIYHLQFFFHQGPNQHGWPITRPRMYCLGFLRKKLTFVGNEAEYKQIFNRSLKLDGDAFFFLKPEDPEVMHEKAALALSRRMHLNPAFDPPWDKLYPPNKQTLIAEHKKIYEQRHPGRPFSEKSSPTYICDLDQNMGFSSPGPNWPCLVRHGTVFHLKKNRHATRPEVFAAQGFPVHSKCKAAYKCGFQPVYQQELKLSDAYKLCGNAMFVPTLASMMLYAMCSVELQPAELIRPSSRLFTDDSQEQT